MAEYLEALGYRGHAPTQLFGQFSHTCFGMTEALKKSESLWFSCGAEHGRSPFDDAVVTAFESRGFMLAVPFVLVAAFFAWKITHITTPSISESGIPYT